MTPRPAQREEAIRAEGLPSSPGRDRWVRRCSRRSKPWWAVCGRVSKGDRFVRHHSLQGPAPRAPWPQGIPRRGRRPELAR